MPELPEVEITARRIGAAVAGARIESTLAPGVNALKTYDPPLSALDGRIIQGIRRRGKVFVADIEDELAIVIHLMSAGRLQLFETRASLREFGTKQRAWVKLLRAEEVEQEETITELGPEAWPDPPPFDTLLDAPRPLYALMRDQHVIAGIGRSWVDEILHAAKISPFKRGSDLEGDEAERLRAATVRRLGEVVDHYEQVISLPIPDKLPMPLTVHRHNGKPCPRCGDQIEAVFYEDYVMCYCPTCQTEGKLMKDRRLSRLLK